MWRPQVKTSKESHVLLQLHVNADFLKSFIEPRVVCLTIADLCNLAHFINVSLLLFKLREGRLNGSDGRIVVGDWAHGREPTGVVEPGNVDGRRRRGDYDGSWRRAG